jgi:hypothetical protein
VSGKIIGKTSFDVFRTKTAALSGFSMTEIISSWKYEGLITDEDPSD